MSLTRWFVGVLYVPVQTELNVIAKAGQLWNVPTAAQLPWFGTLLWSTQGLAAAVLVARFAYEAFLLSSLRAGGESGSFSGLLRRTGAAAVAIPLGPVLAAKAVELGNGLGQLIVSTPLAPPISTLVTTGGIPSQATTVAFWTVLMAIPTLILMILVFIQAAVRSIEFLIIVLAAPLMGLGFLSGGGTADIWWREVFVIACTEAVQLTGLYIGVAAMVTPTQFGSGAGFLTPFAALAALWVAFRAPHLLREFTYHSGLGGAAGSLAQTGATAALMRVLPF